MLHAGARTQTETEMAQVFHFPLEQDRLHVLYRELLASIDRGAAFEGYRLNVANRLWGQQGFPFLSDYLRGDPRHVRRGTPTHGLRLRPRSLPRHHQPVGGEQDGRAHPEPDASRIHQRPHPLGADQRHLLQGVVGHPVRREEDEQDGVPRHADQHRDRRHDDGGGEVPVDVGG